MFAGSGFAVRLFSTVRIRTQYMGARFELALLRDNVGVVLVTPFLLKCIYVAVQRVATLLFAPKLVLFCSKTVPLRW